MQMPVILDISGLTIVHGKSFEIAIQSFTLRAGDVLCVTGDSGCGKSSLLDVLALMAPPATVDRFALSLSDGAPPTEVKFQMTPARLHKTAVLRTRAIGYAPQAGGMLPFLTARADIASALSLRGKADPGWQDRQLRFAQRLNMAEDMDKSRSELSGGQRKRVSLLRVLAIQRRLLVLDEPTAGLDKATATVALRLLRETTAKERSACVIASHDEHLATAAGFEVVRLADLISGHWQHRKTREAL